jgi:hypothetical protein
MCCRAGGRGGGGWEGKRRHGGVGVGVVGGWASYPTSRSPVRRSGACRSTGCLPRKRKQTRQQTAQCDRRTCILNSAARGVPRTTQQRSRELLPPPPPRLSPLRCSSLASLLVEPAQPTMDLLLTAQRGELLPRTAIGRSLWLVDHDARRLGVHRELEDVVVRLGVDTAAVALTLTT